MISLLPGVLLSRSPHSSPHSPLAFLWKTLDVLIISWGLKWFRLRRTYSFPKGNISLIYCINQAWQIRNQHPLHCLPQISYSRIPAVSYRLQPSIERSLEASNTWALLAQTLPSAQTNSPNSCKTPEQRIRLHSKECSDTWRISVTKASSFRRPPH